MLMEIAHDDPDSTLGWCDDQTEFSSLDLILCRSRPDARAAGGSLKPGSRTGDV
jgi:hypothetical protein